MKKYKYLKIVLYSNLILATKRQKKQTADTPLTY